jgi:hypothetical protein
LRLQALIIVRYLSDLQAKLARLERNSAGPLHSTGTDAPVRPEEGSFSDNDEQQREPDSFSSAGTRESSLGIRQDHEGANLVNPLIESPSKFMSSSTGRKCELVCQD